MFLGIDNGFSGGLAVYDGQKLVEAIPMPTIHVTRSSKTKNGNLRKGQEINEPLIADWLRRVKPTHAVVELANAMPKQGAVSMFSFGVSYGTVRGILGALGIPYQIVAAPTWMKEMLGTGRPAGESKQYALAASARLFPGFNFICQGRRIPDEGMIDAALMAAYCARLHAGVVATSNSDVMIEEEQYG